MIRKKIYLSLFVSLLLLVGFDFSLFNDLAYGKGDEGGGKDEGGDKDEGGGKDKINDGKNDDEDISLDELFGSDEDEDKDAKDKDAKDKDAKDKDAKDKKNDVPFKLPFIAVPFP